MAQKGLLKTIVILTILMFTSSLSLSQTFGLVGQNKPLDLDDLKKINGGGRVVIIKNFSQNGEAYINVYESRIGQEEFFKMIEDIITSWTYQADGQNITDGQIFYTVDTNNGELLVDISEFAGIHKNFKWPNLETMEGKRLYVSTLNFDIIEGIRVILPKGAIQNMQAPTSLLKNFIDNLKSGFAIIFTVLIIAVIGILVYYLSSKIFFVVLVIISALLFISFIGMGWSSADILIILGIFILLTIGSSAWLGFKNKSRLHPSKVSAKELNNKYEKFVKDWEAIINVHRDIVISGKNINEQKRDWNGQVKPELQKIVKKIETTKTVNSGKTSPWLDVLHAGIQNHYNNGVEWYVSQEIDRSVDREIDNQVELLKGQWQDWLWAIAGIAPMVGLLGTVVGIAQSFGKISTFGGADQQFVIQRLAGGINMALYTTIVGLIIGMLSLLCYYLIKSRLDSIRAQWLSWIVKITNKL